jgi:hypothetical protein
LPWVRAGRSTLLSHMKNTVKVEVAEDF